MCCRSMATRPTTTRGRTEAMQLRMATVRLGVWNLSLRLNWSPPVAAGSAGTHCTAVGAIIASGTRLLVRDTHL